jgi:hypothetical protein
MIDPTEAAVVRMVFSEYVQRRSVTAVMQTLNTQAIPTKRHTAATGRTYAGGRWSKSYVRKLLANPLYLGHVRYRGEVYPGQHEAIIDTATWQQVQALLGHDARPVRAPRHAALLRGRIRCGHCGCAMTPSCSRSGDRVYRYYLCSSSHRFATRECPNRSIPAGTVEMAVVDQVMQLMQSPDPLLTQLQETQNTPAQRQQMYLLCATLHRLKRTWGTLQPAAQQETIRRLVRQVIVYPDRVDLEFASDEMLELTGGEGAHG